MGGASLAPQLQVINAVLEIKIYVPLWGLHNKAWGVASCPQGSIGAPRVVRCCMEHMPRASQVRICPQQWHGLPFPLPAREYLPLQAPTSCRRLHKVGDRGLLSRNSVNIKQGRCRSFEKTTGCFVQTKLQLEHCCVLVAFHAFIKSQLKEQEASGKNHLHQCRGREWIYLLSVLLALTSRLPIYYFLSHFMWKMFLILSSLTLGKGCISHCNVWQHFKQWAVVVEILTSGGNT